MKINQYCSVCKKQLDMEVIPTDDGGDDGVIWLRCPECQGFLPKFSGDGFGGAGQSGTTGSDSDAATADQSRDADRTATTGTVADEAPASDEDDAAPKESPAATDDTGPDDEAAAPDDTDAAAASDEAAEADSEPIAEYAAQLAEADLDSARPYRPTATFAVGDVVHHLAYDDFGIVVAEENLPGGRHVAKVYFEKAGVVRLIARSPDSD